MNTTFTNCAEKKAKQFLNLLQGYTKGIRFTAILILLLMGVSSAWAGPSFGGGYVYFHNKGGWNDTYKQLCIGKSSYTSTYTMTTISNTQLWYDDLPTSGWGDATYMAVIGNSSSWGSGNWGTSNLKNANHRTASVNLGNWGFNNNNTQMLTPANGNNDAALVLTYVGSEYSSMNNTITIKAKVSTNGGSSYSDANTPAKLTGSSKVFTSFTSCAGTTDASATLNAGSESTTFKAGYTANTALTAVAATGYTFTGWYTDSKVSSELESTVNPTGATTYYAYYKANQYTVKFNANGGTGTMSDQSYAYGVSQALTANTFTRTGYTFAGWNTKADGTGTKYTDKQSVRNLSSTDGATITLYAQWTEKTYSLTFKHDGHGTIKVGGTTVNSGGTASVNHINTKTLVATPNTGYNFSKWTLSGSNTGAVTIGSTTTASTTIKATNTGATVTANFTPKTYTITLDKNGGASNGSATATYNSSTITNLTHPNRTDYRCNGYYNATSGGTLVLNIDGTLAKNVSGYTDSNGNWTKDGTATLYAQWTYDVTEFTVTFGAGTGFTSYGTVTAKNNSTSKTITSPATVRSGQNITFTATPKPGYIVEGWYTNAACTAGKHNAGNTTYTTTITAATNVYVKFVEKTWSVAFAAGNGGAVSPKETQTVGEANGVTIIATPNKGYTFTGWTSSNGGKFDDSKSEKTTFKPTANSTVTASFTENLYAITVKSSNKDHGTVSPESGSAGIDTKVTITATPKLGYKFVNWTATNGITIADANSTTTTITASATGTVTANFELIPPTTIYIRSNGSYADFKWNYNSVAYGMTPMDCAGTYYTANILGGVNEITLTGSNNFTTTTLTVPQDDNVLYDLTSTNITHLYLKPHANWTQASARFAVYFFGSNGNAWQSMTAVGTSGYYEAAIPAGSWTGVIFCRMNPSSSTNGWTQDTQLWNQTADLQFPTDGNNLYTLTGGTWSNVTGSWSAHYDNSRWTTFDAPKLDVKINITGKGSIVIDGETYTSITTGTETFAFTKASGENIAVGAITPEDRWALTSRQITMCDETIDLAASHTISGPATINLSFTQTSCEVVFNLNLPKGTEHPIISAQYVAVGEKATKPTLNEINGYIFGGWYSDRNCTQAYNFENSVTTDITIHAKWVLHSQCIFFKNNLNWNDVYVYTFKGDVWGNDGKGVYPANRHEYGKMTQIGQTEVYYYILTKQDGFNHIAFSDVDMHDASPFNGNKAIYRSDRSDQMPLFIPEKDQFPSTTNSTKYYSSGIWMKYNSTYSGYDFSGKTADSNWKDINLTTDKTGGYTFTAKVKYNASENYEFKFKNLKGDWFGNGDTMTQDSCTNWFFAPDVSDNAKIEPNVSGDYVFTIYLGDGYVQVSLEYPLSIGDYRLAYKDKTENSHHPGHYLKKRSTSQTDTVSFFIHHNQTPEIIVEECTEITDGVPAWAKVTGITINPAASITESGVYNFYLQQIDGNTLPTLLQKADPYKGNYYIRTDAADGGWDAFRQQSNKITYSSFADKHSNFNHYYCKYIDAGRNVKFTIANDYSYCISDTLDNDDIIKKGQSSIGCLPINANVRFGWDSNTNEISRAYIKGAGQTSDRFLVLQGKDDNLKDANGDPIPKGTGVRTGLEANEEILVDQQNWIYQVDVTANQSTQVKLIAEYNGTTQYFKGNEKEYTGLLSSTAAKEYKIRLVYDFKSNHLITAWMAAGETIEGEQALGADMMVIRRNQEPADQLNFNPLESSLDSVKTGYAVMTFTKAHLENLQEDNKTPLPENQKKTERERSLYWVSFPFDVKISDVFGFGEYAEHWIMQYYDGAERAEKGLFIDSGTYWKYIEDTKTTLEAGTGYVLALDLSKVEFLYGATEVSLYFPSADSLKTITGELPTADTVPEHWCNIDREWTDGGKTYYHEYTDSHWNLIGVPGFADIDFDLSTTGYHFMQDDASFYYYFNLANSKYKVEDSHSTEFQAMYAYMVQFAGTIDWTSSTVVGATPTEPKLAARRYSDDQPEKVVLRLELAQGEEEEDHTFVQLQQEGATSEFDLSVDLTKIINSGANIYTLAGEYSIQTAGNALPMEEAVVPVGVDIATAGEYTFRMPDGTEGMVVELIDYELETKTNLLLFDYTVTLPAGSNESRFVLHIQPNKSGVTTGVENVGDKAKGIEKYLIDGKLIIRTAEGEVFDAQGHRL